MAAPAAPPPADRAIDPVADIVAAIQAGDEAGARARLAAHPGVVNAAVPEGGSLLLMAIFARRAKVVEALLAAGAVPGLAEAAALGDVARLRAISRADPQALADARDGLPPLHLAAHYGRLDAMTVLINLGADVAWNGGAFRNTALHAACAGGQGAAVELLLRAGAPPDVRDANGYTALMIAAAAGCLPAIQALLRRGADPRIQGPDGKTAADIAEARGQDEVVPFLRPAAGAPSP